MGQDGKTYILTVFVAGRSYNNKCYSVCGVLWLWRDVIVVHLANIVIQPLPLLSCTPSLCLLLTEPPSSPNQLRSTSPFCTTIIRTFTAPKFPRHPPSTPHRLRFATHKDDYYRPFELNLRTCWAVKANSKRTSMNAKKKKMKFMILSRSL